MSSSHGDKRSSDVEMGEATSPAPILTSPVEAPACVADHLSFRERLVRRQAEREQVRAGADLPSSSALAVAPGHGTEGVTPRDTGTLAGSVIPDASALPAGSSTTPILVEDKERAADSMPPPPARKEIVLALRTLSVVPVAQPKGRKRKFTKGGDRKSSPQGDSIIASWLRGKGRDVTRLPEEFSRILTSRTLVGDRFLLFSRSGVGNLRHRWHVDGMAHMVFEHGIPMITLYNSAAYMGEASEQATMMQVLNALREEMRVMRQDLGERMTRVEQRPPPLQPVRNVDRFLNPNNRRYGVHVHDNPETSTRSQQTDEDTGQQHGPIPNQRAGLQPDDYGEEEEEEGFAPQTRAPRRQNRHQGPYASWTCIVRKTMAVG
ncbi:hypothetical protein F2Q68_00005638 [Brassica cretica]|uniref:Uncharacterized protein n=1 Tax=Brassica cretica TaxID=69181 RepID=A0A8S9JAF4_BRACR|nr:hypothetical protein F2Q68_00005638 [Brassica cretica]